ncbi:hypothetical protein TREPR_3553 [Treponema primitia ZAS-2]|uniref:Uncharacterized protein n=1 Tax=Treponema primitia (strain ATCC BAA-887 / DSM 12427 / ZAS-2) TaxID=545694 RepID=F5YIC0_TREPZ|nr:hypothetical protein TREPR_3553 [Treponema primitia ZAS-2]
MLSGTGKGKEKNSVLSKYYIYVMLRQILTIGKMNVRFI